MESVPAGRLLAMLLDGLQAACRQVEQLDRGSHPHTCPYHASLATKKQLFPQGCVVSFALGRSNGQVHVDLPCAYLSVTVGCGRRGGQCACHGGWQATGKECA